MQKVGHLQAFDPKLPICGQVDLDFVCPELQLTRSSGHSSSSSSSKKALQPTQAAYMYGVVGGIGGGGGAMGGSGVGFPADIFSLGMLICALFNNGEALINCDSDVSIYAREIEQV